MVLVGLTSDGFDAAVVPLREGDSNFHADGGARGRHLDLMHTLQWVHVRKNSNCIGFAWYLVVTLLCSISCSDFFIQWK